MANINWVLLPRLITAAAELYDQVKRQRERTSKLTAAVAEPAAKARKKLEETDPW